MRDEFAVHADVQSDEARNGAAPDDNVVERHFTDRLAIAMPAYFNQGTGFVFKFALPNMIQGTGEFGRRHGGEKAEAANVDAEQGGGGTGEVAGGAQHGAVAAKHEQ